jgi:UrcA family protein
MNRVATLILVGAVGGLSASRVASAGEIDTRHGTVTVRYSQQELQNPESIRRLYDLLNTAARQVCWSYDSVDLIQRRAFYMCVSLSIDRAVRQIHDPSLSAYHLQRVTRRFSVVAQRTAAATDRLR